MCMEIQTAVGDTAQGHASPVPRPARSPSICLRILPAAIGSFKQALTSQSTEGMQQQGCLHHGRCSDAWIHAHDL